MQQQRQPQVLRLAHSRFAKDDTSFMRVEENRQLQDAGVLDFAQGDTSLGRIR
jgi:hypothetical protein